jgi:PAS domain S-box-containing protein
MIVLSYLSFSRINRLNILSGWVNHTTIVKLKLQETYADLSDADSELNKFLLTRDSAYLTRMFECESRINTSIKDLDSLTNDNELQRRRIHSLDSLIKVRFALMDFGLRHDIDKYEPVAAQITSLNTLTRNRIAILKNEEQRLLREREISVSEYKSWTPIMIFTIELAIIGFLFIAYSRIAFELKVKAKLRDDLEQQMSFIQAILDNSVDAIIAFDRKLNIISANNTAMKVFNIPERTIGRSMFEEYPKSRNSISHKAIERALAGEHVHIPSLQSQVVDRIYESFFIPLSKGGTIYAAMAIHHDITELVRASRELEKRNVELKVSNDQLEQFAYIASHDLQEPLRKIQTFSSMAAKHSNSEVVNNYLSKIDVSAARMSKLVRDILSYSRLSNDATDYEHVDLNEVFVQVIQDFELIIMEKRASIKLDRLPLVQGSRQQMMQLFGNLTSNALKFSKETPEIVVTAKIDDNYHVISFTDNGIGFEQKYESHIFEVFKRLHSLSEFSGTGIGLSICKRIVENHKGSIDVESTPGIGTTFTIRIPAMRMINGNLTSDNDIKKKESPAVLK